MSTKFSPFGNESDCVSLGDNAIENHVGYVSLVGQWDIERSKEGLRSARMLAGVLQRAIEVMVDDELAGKLPETLEKHSTLSQVENPFESTVKSLN
jgi:hypothetical protein